MMTRPHTVRVRDVRTARQEDVRRALLWLDELDRRGGGYLRRGVRGWALLQQVEEGVGPFLGNVGEPMTRRRFVTREDGKAPGRSRPVWLLRITEAGARWARGAEWVPDRRVPEPGPRGPEDAAVYLPPGAAAALRALRIAAGWGVTDARAASGADGWTLRGLQQVARATGASAAFPAESLAWLGERGLAEIQRPRDGGRTVVLCRLSPAGRELGVLDFSEGNR